MPIKKRKFLGKRVKGEPKVLTDLKFRVRSAGQKRRRKIEKMNNLKTKLKKKKQTAKSIEAGISKSFRDLGY